MNRKNRIVLLTLAVITLGGSLGFVGIPNKKADTNTTEHAITSNIAIARKRDLPKKVVKSVANKTTATVKKTTATVKKYWKVPLNHNLQDYISSLCKKYGVSEKMAYGVMQTESNYDPNMISDTNDYGLFQINVVNRGWLGKKLGITNWFDPYQNCEAGIYMLSMLQQKYHDFVEVTMAYHLGEGGMRYSIRRGIWSNPYSNKVESAMEGLQTV